MATGKASGIQLVITDEADPQKEILNDVLFSYPGYVVGDKIMISPSRDSNIIRNGPHHFYEIQKISYIILKDIEIVDNNVYLINLSVKKLITT